MYPPLPSRKDIVVRVLPPPARASTVDAEALLSKVSAPLTIDEREGIEFTFTIVVVLIRRGRGAPPTSRFTIYSNASLAVETSEPMDQRR